jgi:hypothetical protein
MLLTNAEAIFNEVTKVITVVTSYHLRVLRVLTSPNSGTTRYRTLLDKFIIFQRLHNERDTNTSATFEKQILCSHYN